MAHFRFNADGSITIITPQETKHCFLSVSKAVNWCNKHKVLAYIGNSNR